MNQEPLLLYDEPVSRLSDYLAREWPSLILGPVLLALVFTGLMSPKGPRDLLVLRHRRAELEAKRARLAAHQQDLETLVQSLRSDDRYLEHLIRRELGYARPDELVYKFTGQGAAPGP